MSATATTPLQTPQAANVADFLRRRARADPDGVGLIVERRGASASATWAELDQRADLLARRWTSLGIEPGDRVLVLAPPDREWLATIQALWRMRAVPVLIDGGMERSSLLAACRRIDARALIGSTKALVARRLFPGAFAGVEIEIAHGGELVLVRERSSRERQTLATADAAAVLFTSGATGPAKGAVYSHANFIAQVDALRRLHSIDEGDVDVACFPLFALFNAALGITSVLPDLDFARPGRCDPAAIVDALERHRARQSFGSPAIWKRVIGWCEARGERLRFLERMLIAGAPVQARLALRGRAILQRGEVHTPYGATEALPVASADGASIERVRERIDGCGGAYLGAVAPGVEVRVVRTDDQPIARMDASALAAPGEIGELCVRGPAVTSEYGFEPAQTANAKIADEHGFWHRMGDLGRIDERGELWLVGRKSQRIETARGAVHPVPIENVVDLHEYVEHSAVVGVGARGRERPFAIVVAKPGKLPRSKRLRERLGADILRAGMWFPCARELEGVLFARSLPVDRRHNAKIDRAKLKRWAQAKLE